MEAVELYIPDGVYFYIPGDLHLVPKHDNSQFEQHFTRALLRTV